MNKVWTARYDRVFKAIFCDEDNKHMMIKLLSNILEKEIMKLTFLNSELLVSM